MTEAGSECIVADWEVSSALDPNGPTTGPKVDIGGYSLAIADSGAREATTITICRPKSVQWNDGCSEFSEPRTTRKQEEDQSPQQALQRRM